MKVATASNPRLDQRWDQQLSPDTGCVGLPGGWSRAWAWVLVPLTFAVTLLYGQASGACAPPLQPRRGLPGPAPCRSADSALNSLRNPTEAGTGRSFCAGTPAGVGEVSLQRDTSPCGSLHPCFTGTMAGPGLPSHLELSLRAVPGVRPLRGPGGAKVWAWCGRWCPVPGEMAGGVRCLQGPRSSEGDGDCHFYQWGYLRCGTGFVALGLPGLALDKQHLPQPRPGAWEPLYLK